MSSVGEMQNEAVWATAVYTNTPEEQPGMLSVFLGQRTHGGRMSVTNGGVDIE